MKLSNHWPNHCEHQSKCYAGTYHIPDDGWYDVYVDKEKVCIRFGSEPNAYYSGDIRSIRLSRTDYVQMAIGFVDMFLKKYH